MFGGSAGSGKSYALLLEAARYTRHPEYRGVIFRRTNPQIVAAGGLWDTSSSLYPGIGAKANISTKDWRFPSGGKVGFKHLQYEANVYDWQGSQIPFVGWDELCHFTERQFFYMLSRNRSEIGVKPYVRATCNPDAGSWVAVLLSWWIDQETGYPIPERSGVLRYFYRKGDDMLWYDSAQDAMEANPELAEQAPPKSLTFIPAKLSDNAILCQRDPGYRANLMALSWVERSRLLDGNWKVTAADGMFRADWFGHGEPPTAWKSRVRAWDFAATESNDKNDPDYTVGVLMGLDHNDKVWVLDVQRVRYSPGRMKTLVKDTAEADGTNVRIVIEQEPGSSGKYMAHEFRDMLNGYNVTIDRPDKRTGDKVARASGYSAAVEKGTVLLGPGAWSKAFVSEHVTFPFGAHDDIVDASSSCFRYLVGKKVTFLV